MPQRNPISEQIQREAVRVLQALKRIHSFAQHAAIGKQLLEILEAYDTVIANQGKTGDDMEISLTASRGELRKVVVRKDLVTAMAALLGNEKRKKCAGPCQQEKVLSAFSIDKMREDGRNRFCLLCERRRVKEYTRKKKQQEQGGAT